MTAWSDAQSTQLLISHRYGDGVSWGYIAGGITEDGAAPRLNTTTLVEDVVSTFGTELRAVSLSEDVPIELLIAAVCTFAAEAVGASASATREAFDHGFMSHETTPQLVRVGCTGIRFDKALEMLGTISVADFLATPSPAILAAARHIVAMAAVETRFQPPMVASAYNDDGLRFDNRSRWRLAGQDQTDRFVGWFNTTIRWFQLDPSRVGPVPSFFAQLSLLTPSVTPTPSPSAQAWPVRRPESIAAMEEGMATVCPSNPSLSAIWALDQTTTDQIKSVAQDAANPLIGLPNNAPIFAYPDRGGTMRIMTAPELIALYRGMRDYVSAIIYYDSGRTEALPGQPVLLSP